MKRQEKRWNREEESLVTETHLTHDTMAVSDLALYTVPSSQQFNNTKLFSENVLYFGR